MSEVRELHLHARHLEAGAAMGELRGALVPCHYGDVGAEYAALRQGAGIIDRSSLARLEFSGGDHVDYLQRMTSNDVAGLEPGDGCYSTLLTDRGKLIADFRLFRLEDSVRVHLDPLRKQAAVEPLERLIIMDDVAIADVSEDLGMLGVYGPKAAALLSSVFRLDMQEMPEYRNFLAFYAGEDLMVACQRIAGEDGYEIWVPREEQESLWNDLLAAAPNHGARPVGHDALNIARVEAGVPVFGVDMDESNIALEAGLVEACSVTKGCYVGQEIIARIHHLGHINRELAGLKFRGEGLPVPGDTVHFGSRKIGTVSSSVQSPRVGCGIGLAILRSDFLEPETVVTIRSGEETQEAEVTQLPFERARPQ